MGMGISEAEWAAMAADFQATLDAFKVPAQEQKELFDIVGTTKADIVGQGGKRRPDPPAESPYSLYARLGGTYAIAAVADDFIKRLLANKTVLANPKVAGMADPKRVPGLWFHLTAQIVDATGGPYKYQGESMKESHMGMGISEAEWAAMAGDFKATLDAFKVPKKEQDELFAIVGTTKADIVEKP